jgi:hypothetical protein
MGTNWSEFANNKAVKIAGFTLLGLICLMTFTGIFTNKPIKIWFIEFNRRDTAFKYINVIIRDTTIKTVSDTVRIVYDSDKPTISKTKPRYSYSAPKYDLKGSKFNGPTQIGDSNTQNNIINGIKQRHASSAVINKIIAKMNAEGVDSVSIGYPGQDKESENYATEIAQFLQLRGIKKLGFAIIISNGRSDEITFMTGGKGYITPVISSAPNVQ